MCQAYQTIAVEAQNVGAADITEWLNALPGAQYLCPDRQARRIAAVRHFTVMGDRIIALVTLDPSVSEARAANDAYQRALMGGSELPDSPSGPEASPAPAVVVQPDAHYQVHDKAVPTEWVTSAVAHALAKSGIIARQRIYTDGPARDTPEIGC